MIFKSGQCPDIKLLCYTYVKFSVVGEFPQAKISNLRSHPLQFMYTRLLLSTILNVIEQLLRRLKMAAIFFLFSYLSCFQTTTAKRNHERTMRLCTKILFSKIMLSLEVQIMLVHQKSMIKINIIMLQSNTVLVIKKIILHYVMEQ